MSTHIHIGIANGHFLVREGLLALQAQIPTSVLSFSAADEALMKAYLTIQTPDILILDHNSPGFSEQSLLWIRNHQPSLRILSISCYPTPAELSFSLKNGVSSFVLAECDLAELVEAIQHTCNGNDFVCGKVLEIMNHAPVETVREASCEGITLTEREIDIVRLIAEGNSNKQIADELCLSTHTVNTHRKNIMAKLKVNNTAGLVMFAVKENLLHRNKFLFS